MGEGGRGGLHPTQHSQNLSFKMSTTVAIIGAMYISISITHLVFTYPFKFHYL